MVIKTKNEIIISKVFSLQLKILDETKQTITDSTNWQNITTHSDRNSDQLIRINSEISQSISRDIELLFINNLTNNQKIKINENLLNSLFQNDS